MSKAHEEESLL